MNIYDDSSRKTSPFTDEQEKIFREYSLLTMLGYKTKLVLDVCGNKKEIKIDFRRCSEGNYED